VAEEEPPSPSDLC